MVDKMLLLYKYLLLPFYQKLILISHCATLPCFFVTLCALTPFCTTTRYSMDIELTVLWGRTLMLTFEGNLVLWLGIQWRHITSLQRTEFDFRVLPFEILYKALVTKSENEVFIFEKCLKSHPISHKYFFNWKKINLWCLCGKYK